MIAGILISEDVDFREKLVAANINPDSCLATDYLNHFNEVVMLLEMALDMPDLLDEAAEWKPASYVEHFIDSDFVSKELVVEAYGCAPDYVRSLFEDVVASLDHLVLSMLGCLSDASSSDDGYGVETRTMFGDMQRELQALLGRLNAIIHNQFENAEDQTSGNMAEETAAHAADAHSQDAIDQLFD